MDESADCRLDAFLTHLSYLDSPNGCIILANKMNSVEFENLSTHINRKEVVSRHNVIQNSVDPLSPLTVGNGRFCFTADVTGINTLRTAYEEGIPLSTMAEWGWNAHPNVTGAQPEECIRQVQSGDREVPYLVNQDADAANWLRANPHQSNLGSISFVTKDGRAVAVEAIEAPNQVLDLWRGHLHSTFIYEGASVEVETLCHPDSDTIGIRAKSPKIADGALAIEIAFPYTSAVWGRDPADWTNEEGHTSTVTVERSQTTVQRQLDTLAYSCVIGHGPAVSVQQSRAHAITIYAHERDTIELTVTFTQEPVREPLSFTAVKDASAAAWAAFWQSGGAVDFSASQDPRWMELERRVVLSQYVTACQSTGALPPAETGLTCNSWFGKFHLEMHWWHCVHFALWGRIDKMLPSLDFYRRILNRAQETARNQGYAGARWPKMVGPEGKESPSNVGPFLIWQQPHPIYYAELCYRQDPSGATLDSYREIVFETAEFMADYARWNEESGCYDLGPPLIPAQENHPPESTINPTYELVYWRWALTVAQDWRTRLGMPRKPEWDKVIEHLAPLPMRDSLYVATENRLDTWEDSQLWRDHPSFLCALGVLPGQGVDQEAMRATLKKTHEVWNWEGAWGWDFPVAAMCAARLGEGALAIDLLLMDVTKNRYLPNGHNYQAERLPLYLPGNGGLLTSIAMMAHGWDGQSASTAFPDGWTVRHEGLQPMP